MISNNRYKHKRARMYNKSFLSILVLLLISFSFNCVWADSGNSISTYFDTVQEIYIGYYQRPADPGGLIYWANRLFNSGGNLSEIIEAFANSAESQALYGTINSSNISTVVNGIYKALFGRDAETEGLNYYVNNFNSGRFTAATIMLNILYGAQNEDLQSVNNKVTAANLFTRTIDPCLEGTNFQATYSGDTDAQKARDFLSTITFDPGTIPTQTAVTAWIRNNIAVAGDPIITPTVLTISSLSTNSAAPFSSLTITGSGFDPLNSAISVLFIPGGSGLTIAVPAFSACPDTLEVIVPPFLDTTTGFSSGVTSVQAIQASGSSLMTSNTIVGLNIASLPSVPASYPPGAFTVACLNSSLALLNDIQTFAATSPNYADLLSAANALSADLNSTMQAIGSIIQNPTQTINLPTVNGKPFVLDAATLVAADQLVSAELQQLLQQFLDLLASPDPGNSTSVLADPPCLPGVDATGMAICTAEDGTRISLQEAQQQVSQVAGSTYNSGVNIVKAHWYLYLGLSPVVAVACAPPTSWPVCLGALGAIVGIGILDVIHGWHEMQKNAQQKTTAAQLAPAQTCQLAAGSLGVPPDVVDGASLVATATKLSSAPIGADPQGGLILSEAPTSCPTGSNALVALQPSAAGATAVTQQSGASPTAITEQFCSSATAIPACAPESQGTVTLPPPCTYTYSDWSACQPNNTQTRTVISSSPPGCGGTPVLTQSCKTPTFQGTLSGYWSGTCVLSIGSYEYSYDVSGGFSISIGANGNVTGSYSGDDSGSILGTVNINGNLTATGTAGGFGWSGQLTRSDNSLSVSGAWAGTEEDFSCHGGWFGSGAASF